MASKIKIDPEFSALIPDVADGEAGELEREVLADGRILNPLIVWSHQNILLDGHRRYKLTVKHPTLKMPPPIVMDFESRQEAHDWIIRHQLSKRNVTDAQRRYLIGKLYRDANKKPIGGDHSATVAESSTAAKIALSEGVSERTVHNNAAFAEAVDAAAEVVPEVKAAVLSGEVKATAKDLEKLAELPPKKAAAAARKIASGEAKSVKAALPKPKPDADSDDGGFEPHEASKPLAEMDKLLTKMMGHLSTAEKILGKTTLATVHSGLDATFKALTKVRVSLRKSK